VRALGNEKISWVLGSPKLRNPPPPTTEHTKATPVFFKKKEGKKNPNERDPPQRIQRHADSLPRKRSLVELLLSAVEFLSTWFLIFVCYAATLLTLLLQHEILQLVAVRVALFF